MENKSKLKQLETSIQTTENNPQETSENNEKTETSTTVETKKISKLLFKWIKNLLLTKWGLRISFILIGIVLFYLGFLIGNIGKTTLKNKVEDKKAQIKMLKTTMEKSKTKIKNLKTKIKSLEFKLSDSEQKRKFYLKRNNIRKPLIEATESWKQGNHKKTVELLYKTLLTLKNESQGAMGIAKLIYTVINSKIHSAIHMIENDCTSSTNTDTSSNETSKNISKTKCDVKVLNIIKTSLDILISPDSK